MIYVVDDNVEFLQLIKALLGDNVKTFDFPVDALKAIVADRPQVVITDVFMPLVESSHTPPQGMNGLELVEILSSVMPNIDIVVVSGNTKENIEEHFNKKMNGITCFFEKPLNQDFVDTVLRLEKGSKITEVTVRLTEIEMEKIKVHKLYNNNNSLEANILMILGSAGTGRVHR